MQKQCSNILARILRFNWAEFLQVPPLPSSWIFKSRSFPVFQHLLLDFSEIMVTNLGIASSNSFNVLGIYSTLSFCVTLNAFQITRGLLFILLPVLMAIFSFSSVMFTFFWEDRCKESVKELSLLIYLFSCAADPSPRSLIYFCMWTNL